MPEGEYRSPRHCCAGDQEVGAIAACYGVSVSALLELNPWLSPGEMLAEGDVLVLPAVHGLDGSIAAISDRYGGPGLLIFNAEDWSSKMLASVGCSWASVAALSPDGRLVAIQGADGKIHIVDVHADLDRAITQPLAGLVTPRWSPSGESIMYEIDAHVYVVDADSGAMKQSFEGQFASWLGDGYRMAYVHSGNVIMREMADGSGVLLTDAPERVCGLAAASYGESVAYIACEDEGVVMCIVDVLTGETVRSKVDREVWPWSIAWAPDGKMIAYCVGQRNLDNGQAVKVIILDPRDGSCRHEAEVVSDPRYSGLAWSPDSRAVAVSARIEGTGRYGVYVVHPGGGLFQLTGTGNVVFPDWGRTAGQ